MKERTVILSGMKHREKDTQGEREGEREREGAEKKRGEGAVCGSR